jgi:hypothetical protein
MVAQAVDGFVEGLVERSGSELDELLRATELERRSVETKMALIVAVVEQKQQFLVDGHRSMNAYLKAQTNCSGATARRIRRRGKLLNEHVAVGLAMAAGRVSVDNLDLLAKATLHPRVGERVAEFVPVLAGHAEQFPVRHFSVLVDRVIANADTDGVAPDDPDEGDATVAADGVFVRANGGSGLQAAEMKKVFDLGVAAEFARDVEARRTEHGDQADQQPLPRTAKQRRFAALYSIFVAWATVPVDGQRPEPLVNIVFSAGRAQHALAVHGFSDVAVFDTSGPRTCSVPAARRRRVFPSLSTMRCVRCSPVTSVVSWSTVLVSWLISAPAADCSPSPLVTLPNSSHSAAPIRAVTFRPKSAMLTMCSDTPTADAPTSTTPLPSVAATTVTRNVPGCAVDGPRTGAPT